jgi:hypothetical protein
VFWRRRYDAFVSYSHQDEALVKPMVEMLSLNERKVFWDRKLEAGDRWDKVIRSSLERSSVFVLFWCCDTNASEYTAKEIRLALRLKKKIVPVKLCHAAMPRPLGDWQWIDLRQRVQHECGVADHTLPAKPLLDDAPMPAPPKRSGVPVFAVISLFSVMVLFIGMMSLFYLKAPVGDSRPMPPPPTVAVETPALVPVWPEMREAPLPYWYEHRERLLWILGSIAITALVIWRLLKRRRRTEETITLAVGYLRKLETEEMEKR